MTGQTGMSFHLSSNDPATITINAHACSQQYFEWGIRVTYFLDGQQHVEQFGSAAAPYRLSGTLLREVPAYTRNTATGPLVPAHVATARQPLGCAF